MSMKSLLECTCPACGTNQQRLPAFRSLERVFSVKCKECHSVIESDIGWGRYVLLMAYTYLIAGLLGAALIVGMVAGDVVQVMVSISLFAIFGLLPAMILHSRFLVVRKMDKSVRSSDQKH